MMWGKKDQQKTVCREWGPVRIGVISPTAV